MATKSEDANYDAAVASSVFSSINEIQRAVGSTVSQSVSWLKNSAQNMIAGNVTEASSAEADKSFVTRRMDRRWVGRMFMYMYDPKTKDKMTYYDTLPLVILVEFTHDGFYGLNLHYAPPFIRQKILTALTKNMNRKGVTEQAKTMMSYRILKRSSQFEIMKPCFKRYLASHVRSSYLYIDPLEWSKTILLPTERFKKASKATVFRNYINRDVKSKKSRTTRAKTGTQ